MNVVEWPQCHVCLPYIRCFSAATAAAFPHLGIQGPWHHSGSQTNGIIQMIPAETTLPRNLDHVTLPTALRNLTFGRKFNQSLAGVNLPESLCALNFGKLFNQSLEKVALPCNLQQLAFVADSCFDHSLEHVILPRHLQNLSLGTAYNQNFTFPANLQSLTLGTSLAESAALPQLAELISLTLHTVKPDLAHCQQWGGWEAMPGDVSQEPSDFDLWRWF